MDTIRYHFEDRWFDPDTGEVGGGCDTVRLRPKNALLLRTLLDHAGKLVTRTELYEALWPRGGVEQDQGLNASVRQVRIALGDNAQRPRFIETLPRRGYRFKAEVHVRRGPETGSAQVPHLADRPAWTRPALLAVALLLLAVFPWGSSSHGPQAVPSREVAHALYLMDQATPSSSAIADSLLTALIEEKPRAHQALGALARLRLQQGLPGEARSLAERARTLDPHTSSALMVLGDLAARIDWRWKEARLLYRAAASADPGSAVPHRRLAELELIVNDPAAATRSLNAAIALDPVAPYVTGEAGFVHLLARRFEAASEACAESHRLGAPAEVMERCYAYASVLNTPNPLLDAAHMGRAFAWASTSSGPRPSRAWSTEAYWRALLAHARRLGARGHYLRAIGLAQLGQREAALDALDRAVRTRMPAARFLAIDPRLDPIRDLPSYAILQEQVLQGRTESPTG